MMEVTARDLWNIFAQHLAEQIRAARDFPSIKIGAQLFASIPEVVGLLLHLSRRNGMSCDRKPPLGANGCAKLHGIAVGIDPLLDSERDNVGASGIADAVFR